MIDICFYIFYGACGLSTFYLSALLAFEGYDNDDKDLIADIGAVIVILVVSIHWPVYAFYIWLQNELRK